jgi:hypothetical protein
MSGRHLQTVIIVFLAGLWGLPFNLRTLMATCDFSTEPNLQLRERCSLFDVAGFGDHDSK